MTTSTRLNRALVNLYEAFNTNQLNPEDCAKCALGTILQHKESWKHFTDLHGSKTLNYVGLVHQNLGRTYMGYTPKELLIIESSFLEGCGYRLGRTYCHKPDLLSQPVLFNGLCCVIETLYGLDGSTSLLTSLTTLDRYTCHTKTPLKH